MISYRNHLHKGSPVKIQYVVCVKLDIIHKYDIYV